MCCDTIRHELLGDCVPGDFGDVRRANDPPERLFDRDDQLLDPGTTYIGSDQESRRQGGRCRLQHLAKFRVGRTADNLIDVGPDGVGNLRHSGALIHDGSNRTLRTVLTERTDNKYFSWMSAMRSDERTERFIEQMGMLGEEEGLPRIAGRIFGLLLLQSEPCSLDDLADALGVSKASISTDTRRLEGLGYLERRAVPGDRRDYYSISPDVFAHSLRLRLDRMRKFHELIDRAARLPNRDPDVRHRLERLEADYQVAVASIVEVLETWEQSRVAGSPRRRAPTPSLRSRASGE